MDWQLEGELLPRSDMGPPPAPALSSTEQRGHALPVVHSLHEAPIWKVKSLQPAEVQAADLHHVMQSGIQGNCGIGAKSAGVWLPGLGPWEKAEESRAKGAALYMVSILFSCRLLLLPENNASRRALFRSFVQAFPEVSPVEVEMMSSAIFPLFKGDKEIDRLWNGNYAQSGRHPPRKNTSQSSAPFYPPELRMAPPDQAHVSVPSCGFINIVVNEDEGDGVEETEEEGKESNAAETNWVAVHKTSRNRCVSKSIMETLWATFKVKHHIRTPEAIRLAGDLAISVSQVTAWFRRTRRKHREMAKGQMTATEVCADEAPLKTDFEEPSLLYLQRLALTPAQRDS
ncbi:uncharacterized protein LOC119931405 [Tachyglossus aculeatus]|uniref:uncharacterized protein LOC119931405 n=1 Tax=Tachyglossus aculeatus TaxID=9261 RepID=UPI0018F34E12|nr:uncharacterized protein LOC119931405 [Tachyglossus aculeatus]